MIDLRELIKASVHFGHKTSLGAPRMRPFLWGAKNKIHLIDVSKTAVLLERAGNIVKEFAAQGKSLLWVGTKKPAQQVMEQVAKSLNMPFVINRWVGGTLSNHDQVKKGVGRLLHLRDVLKKSASYYKKKEISMIQKEIARLEKNVGGIIDLDYPPAALIVVDAKKELSAVQEAAGLNIPVIAMVDTNTDPLLVNYIIPANDDSPKSIACIMNYLAEQVKAGKAIAEERKAEAAAAAATKRAEKAAATAQAQAEKPAAKKAEAAPAAPAKDAKPKGAPKAEAKKAEAAVATEPAEATKSE